VATKLTKPIRREVEIDGETYTVVISAEGLKVARKRRRSGLALSWRALMRQFESRTQADGSSQNSRGNQ
jgi:hypothetical protein